MWRVSKKCKLIFVSVVFGSLVFYMEVVSYIVNTRSWPLTPLGSADLKAAEDDPEQPLRVLLVSDPQIIGENDEPPFFGLFTRWDADRYLQRNYLLAKYHVRPDIVVFLGDLFDEGSVATDSEYRRYYRRFVDIFQLPRKQDPSPIEYVFIPGDNDVGGEGREPVDSIKLRWFNQTFGDYQKMLWFRKRGLNAQFFKMNLFVPEEYQNPLKAHESVLSSDDLPDFRIVFAHNSLLQFLTTSVKTIVERVNPNVIFAGHSHESAYLRLENGAEDSPLHMTHKFLMGHKYKSKEESQDEPLSELSLTSTIRIDLKKVVERDREIVHEIHVPTCSYRMGTPDMGYGAFHLYKNGTLEYVVLWLPSRFNQLYTYMGAYVLMKLILMSWVFSKCFYWILGRFQRAKHSYHKV